MHTGNFIFPRVAKPAAQLQLSYPNYRPATTAAAAADVSDLARQHESPSELRGMLAPYWLQLFWPITKDTVEVARPTHSLCLELRS
jgi:hypothetical protein